MREIKKKEPKCKHPPRRLYTWDAADGTLCVACCECGKVLKGGVEVSEERIKSEEEERRHVV